MPLQGKIIRLIYFSTSRLVSNPLDPLGALEGLVSRALRNNAALEITGALMYDGERFAQVLEGRPDDVDSVFRKIQEDPRHEGVTLIQRESARQRAFPRWSALYFDPAQNEHVILAQTALLCPSVKDDPTGLLALLRYCVCSPA